MSQSVLDAIRAGKWDYEPDFGSQKNSRFLSTPALPGTQDKVATMAERAQLGLPVWHPEDRRTFDDTITGME